MSTNIETGLKRRDVAPRIIRLGEHEWAWTPLTDRSVVTRRSPASIWEEFCFDARAYYMDNDWSGRKWKFALPAGDGNYDVHDVWDVKTGERYPLPPEAIEGILLPAGWSKWVDKTTVRLEDAMRKSFDLARKHGVGMIGSSGSSVAEEKAWPILSAALESMQYPDLEPAWAQMASMPDGLAIQPPSFDEPTSTVMNIIKASKRPGEMLRMLIHIRVVLGNLRLAQLSLYNY